MTTYTTFGPDEAGDFIIGYPTPGAPHIITAACTARTEKSAAEECARLNADRTSAEERLAADLRARLRGVCP